jgi:hypothetical protein
LPLPTASRAMPQPLTPPPMIARSKIRSKVPPRRSPIHFGDFAFVLE